MSSITWTPTQVAAEARPWAAEAWRIVAAQHAAALMKLVDTPAEYALLDAMLVAARPHSSAFARALHPWLAFPFECPPPPGGSRFRAPGDPGVFYCAESVRTACAELGYWRWRFLRDTSALRRLDPVAHTAFRVQARAAQAIDLRAAPIAIHAQDWAHPSDYGRTQALARSARDAGVTAILYRSVRDPAPGWCAALLSPDCFAAAVRLEETPTWWLSVMPEWVIWRCGETCHAFRQSGG